MSRLQAILNYKANFPGTKIRGKSLPSSISLDDEASCFEVLADLTLPDGIISGLSAALFVGNNVSISPGIWAIDAIQYTIPTVTILGLSAQDATFGRYDVVYGDATGALHIVAGTLSTTPLEPSIPDSTVKICAVLIPPPPGTITIINPPPTGFVDLSTNQSIDGIKTFLKSPQVPIAVNPFDAVPFSQLTTAITAADIIFKAGSLTGTGVTGDAYDIAVSNAISVMPNGSKGLGGSLSQATAITMNEHALTFNYHQIGSSGNTASTTIDNNGVVVRNSHGVNMILGDPASNSAINVAVGVSTFNDRLVSTSSIEINNTGGTNANLLWNDDRIHVTAQWHARLITPGSLLFEALGFAVNGTITFLGTNGGDIIDANGTYFLKNTVLAFAALPASPQEGWTRVVTDSNTATWGATIAGGGANRVMAYFNGVNWTVAAK